ncbi:unnamed protein product, partial [Dibothriocephalus latus]
GSGNGSGSHQRNFGTDFLRRSAPNSASPCTGDTLFHPRSQQDYNPQRQQQQQQPQHHHSQQQQQQLGGLPPQETMTHTVENVVDKLAKFFPLVGASGADKRNVNSSVRDLRIEALLAGFQGHTQEARGEEVVEEDRRAKLSTDHLTDKDNVSQVSSSYRSEPVPAAAAAAKIPTVDSSPSMEDFRANIGQGARAFMEEDIHTERGHGTLQKVPGSVGFVQRQSSAVGGSPSPVPPSSCSPAYSTDESGYGRGLPGQGSGQFFQRPGFYESGKLNDASTRSQSYDAPNSTPSPPPPPPPTSKESDESTFLFYLQVSLELHPLPSPLMTILITASFAKQLSIRLILFSPGAYHKTALSCTGFALTPYLS